MLPLQRLSRRGRKRIHPRIEELIRIDIQALVNNRPWARSSVIDKDGNRLEFVDEMVGTEQRLVVYVNGRPSDISFLLVDVPILGRIKNQISWDRALNYYVVDNGRRYRALYVDPVTRKISTRHSLGAVYTTDSVGRKQLPIWRQWQKARRVKVWSLRDDPY
jgi:hypothetical protein